MINSAKDKIGDDIFERFKSKGGEVKSINAIQQMAMVNDIVFDKRGTLSTNYF
jgi:magnesium-transporting ATPase (P-type)